MQAGSSLKHCIVLATLLTITPAPICADILISDFDDGTLQGWTNSTPKAGTITLEREGGNPGGFMMAVDDIPGGGNIWAQAPKILAGDLTQFCGLQWDETLLSPITNSHTSIMILGADGTIYRAGQGPASPSPWTTRLVPFDPDDWTLFSGSASFEDVITNVEALFITMDVSKAVGKPESGVDNVILVESCLPDIDCSGAVGTSDLLEVLAAWGSCPACPEDFDGDGVVGVAELLTLLANWGPCP